MSTNLYSGAARMKRLSFSPVRKVFDRASQLAAEGRDIIHFEIGEPDFDTPAAILEATNDAMREHLTHYGPNRGLMSLRRAIAQKLSEDNGLDYDPETDILVTVGAAEALLDIILATVGAGDEVLVFTPAFMNYANLVGLAGGKLVCVRLPEQDNYQIDPAAVEAAVTDRTKLMILTNPHNPTGTVFSEETLRALAEIAVRHDLLVISDEIYEDIVYDGVKPVSSATFSGMRERTYVVNGFSKNYAMTGFRLGYLAADARLVTNVLKLHQYVTTCAPTFIQEGVARTMLREDCIAEKHKMVEIFALRRKILMDGIRSIPKLAPNRPQGAFYLFVNVAGTGMDGETFATRLLEEQGVALVPGAGFGAGGENCVRISYATGEREILEGINRIRRLVQSCD